MGPANNLFRYVICWAVGALLLAACSSDTAVTPLPTATLIPPTPTAVQVTPPPTATPRPVIRASQLGDDLPAPLATLDDPIEQGLASAVLADAVQESGLAQADIELVLLESAQWSSASLLGCPQTSGTSDVPGYRMLLIAGGVVYEYHTDNIDAIRLCGRTPLADVDGEMLLLVDPSAAELFAIAQRRLAERFDIPTRRVRLIAMQTIVWPDASLGCPLEGESYEIVDIDGYRLSVTVADETYIFHTAFDRLIECAAADVVLPTEEPELTPEATAEVTPDTELTPEATPETTPDPS